MAPYLAENQGLPKQRPPLGVRKELPTSLNANSKAATSPPSKPTIRVIHIFAPKVIKTDMANFRATVQKLTGRSTKKSRARSSSSTAKVTSTTSAPHHPVAPPPALHPSVRSPEDLILHRLVGDACGAALARSTSIDSSSTYSCDSKDTTDASFSFYVPAHRESAYSLSEIPAPFFGAESMVAPTLTSYDHIHLPALQQLPAPHVMDPGLLSFDVDSLGSGLGSPLPLSEHSAGACDVPFLYLEVVAPRSVGGCMIC